MSRNVTAEKIVEETAKDPILKEVIVKLKNGFKEKDKEGTFAHFTVEDMSLLWKGK